MRLRDFGSLLGAAFAGWNRDNALRLSAALAYYSLFSMAPLLILAIAGAGLVYGEQAARGQVAAQLQELAGSRAADAIQAMVLSASGKTASFSATLVGLAVLLFGASGAFIELKDALNTIWGVEMKPGNRLLALTRDRLISFAMVLAVGFLLLASLIATATLAGLEASIHTVLTLSPHIVHGIDILSSFLVVTVLFAMLFKLLPNVILHWRDVWIGAACTAFLFTAGKFIIGVYLGRNGAASYYGAAGSAIVFLLWVYYSACILFFGAEFTKAYVLKKGRRIVPDSRAALKRELPAAREAAR